LEEGGLLSPIEDGDGKRERERLGNGTMHDDNELYVRLEEF